MNNTQISPGVRIVGTIILCVLFAGLGFYAGTQFVQTPINAPTTGQATSTVDYYSNIPTWPDHERTDASFTLKVPIDFPVDDNFNTKPTTDWRVNAGNTTGLSVLEFEVPKAFEPQTNLDEAKFSIGRSTNATAVKNCLIAVPDNNETQDATTTINGTTFSVFHFGDAGLGNLYESTSYRTLHAGQCYAIEYTIHSSQIANYPEEFQLKPFDEAKLDDLFGKVIGTFKFE